MCCETLTAGECGSRRDTYKISQPDLERHPSSTLVASCEVVADPGDVTRESRVDAARRDEDTRIHHARHAANC